MQKNSRGFTLLELLVVIAVIGILSAITLVLFDEVRAKTRDTKRLSDIREIKKALALYVVNTGGFPISPVPITITGEDAFSAILENELVITEVPPDPLHPSLTYTYQTDASGTNYTLSFCLETNSIQNYSQGCGNTTGP